MKDFLSLLKKCTVNPPTSKAIIKHVEADLDVLFPQEYVDFLLQFNGVEGPIGEENYIRLWRVEEIPILNKEYEVEIYAPGFLIIGSDGGGESIAFDFRHDKVPVSLLPFIGMSAETAISIGSDFRDFLKSYETYNF